MNLEAQPLGSSLADVLVVGAGPAGLTAALALAAHGIQVLVAAPADAPIQGDPRTTALLPSSIELLKNLGAWEICADAAASLDAVRIIDDRGGLLRAPEVLFRARELGLERLAANVPNGALNTALQDRVAAASRIRRLPATAVVRVDPTTDFAAVALANGDTIKARLIVAADGRNSVARAGAGIITRAWTYEQAAIVTTFRHSRPHANTTTELHKPAGPLTCVPLPGNASSLVWVETRAEAGRLAALDDAAFLSELTQRLQGLLGRLGEMGPRATFPLSGLTAQCMGQRRVALVGESAHVMPPIGAQGLNLGLRDAASLADCVSFARAQGEDIGGEQALAAYQRARNADRLSRELSVDLLNRSLLTDFLPAQALRGLGLHLLANLAPLRRLLMQGGLAQPGPLPRLMRPGENVQEPLTRVPGQAKSDPP